MNFKSIIISFIKIDNYLFNVIFKCIILYLFNIKKKC